MADEQQVPYDWHQYFGLTLTDRFTDSPFVVELERDLSVQQQYLDVVVVRRGREPFTERLPDGLEELAEHNLITFKSHHEALDPWAIKELVGHYVAYRKLVSPAPSRLLAEEQFRLYAISARLPQKLSQQVPWQEHQAGVYDCRWGTDTVRVVVARELPCELHNAPLLLFSHVPELVDFAGRVFKPRSERMKAVLIELFKRLRGEGLAVAYRIEEYEREFMKENLPKLTRQEQEEVLQALPPEARLAGLSPEARLAGLSPEARLAGLSAEEMEQIRQHLERVAAGHEAPSRQSQRKN